MAHFISFYLFVFPPLPFQFSLFCLIFPFSFSMMDTQYLRSNVAECLTHCLAELAIARPSDPIAYLAEAMLQWEHDRNPKGPTSPPPACTSSITSVKFATDPQHQNLHLLSAGMDKSIVFRRFDPTAPRQGILPVAAFMLD